MLTTRKLWIALSLFALPAAGKDAALLVLHKGASSLGFYTAEGKLLEAVPVGKHPHEIVLSADRRYAYTADNGTMRIEQPGAGGNTVSIVDLAARRRVGVIDLGSFRRPHGIDLDRATGRVLVSCELPDQLLVLDPMKRAVVRTYDTRGKTSHMVTLAPGGVAFVSNANSASVAAIDLDSGKVELIATSIRPEGSVLAPDGRRLYVANREGARITIIDTARRAAAGDIATGRGPVRIGITPDGRVLVYALIHDRAVELADPETRKVLGRVPLGGEPVSLAVSPDGRLAYAAAQDIDTVYVVSIPERKVVREFKTAPGAGPDPVVPLR